jgi:hypothetical protein
MAIRRFLKDANLGSEDLERLELAYSRALQKLHLVDRDDPIAKMVAKKVIEIGATGVRDPAELSALVVRAIEPPLAVAGDKSVFSCSTIATSL